MFNRKDMLHQTELRSSIRDNANNPLQSFNHMRVSMPNTNLPFHPQMFASPKGTSYLVQQPMTNNPVIFNRTGEHTNFEHIQGHTIDKNQTYTKSPYKYSENRNSEYRSNQQLNVSLPTNPQTPSVPVQRMSSYEVPSGTQKSEENKTYHHNTTSSSQSSHTMKSESSFTNEKTNLTRIEIFTKNHLKSVQVNQIALDILSMKQEYGVYICYLLFRNLCKEIETLSENLKKESNDSAYEEFRNMIESEQKAIKNIENCFYEAILESEDEKSILGSEVKSQTKNFEQIILENKKKLLKTYFENLSNTDDSVRLGSQVIDYLQENIVIKKDAYERMSKEHLQKLMKNKIS